MLDQGWRLAQSLMDVGGVGGVEGGGNGGGGATSTVDLNLLQGP